MSDERLKQDTQHLMTQVHQKFVEVDAAVATQTANSQTASQPTSQAAPQVVPQSAPSATAQPRQDPWVAATAESRMSDAIPLGGVPTPQSEAPRAPSQEVETPRRYSVDPKRWTGHR